MLPAELADQAIDHFEMTAAGLGTLTTQLMDHALKRGPVERGAFHRLSSMTGPNDKPRTQTWINDNMDLDEEYAKWRTLRDGMERDVTSARLDVQTAGYRAELAIALVKSHG